MLDKVKKLKWLPIRHWFDLRDAMSLGVTLHDRVDQRSYRFIGDSFESYQRGRSLLSKEPETIAWLRSHLRPDDVFFDIGANVGIFSIFAAKHLSELGHVYAFEPHLPTTVQLIKNVSANRLENKISVLSIAISGDDGFHPFYYKRWRQGASGSQLAIQGGPGLPNPIGAELKYSLRIDAMIEQGIVRSPNIIKIDTDGLELQITSGMRKLLVGDKRPRSLLVEIQPGEFSAQKAFMDTCGYKLIEAQPVGKWKRMLQEGKSLEHIAFNALFGPESTSAELPIEKGLAQSSISP